MKASQARLTRLRQTIPQVAPAQAFAEQQRGAVLIDVREQDEVDQGSPQGAVRIGRGFLELGIEQAVADLDARVMVLCGAGTRSLFAAEDLRQMGYRRIASVAGGFAAWQRAGLPVERPRGLSDEQRQRYARHLTIPQVGEAGQLKLLDSRVLLVGAGGLGSPAALYLAAAGVGHLGLVDDDVVDRSNLQRQVLHTEDRVGLRKVDSARRALEQINSSIRVTGHAERLEPRNVETLLSGYDVIVDGSDNFPTRYLVNDACVRLGLPDVYGAVYRFEGQVSVFWPGRPERPGPCYRCLYPEPPPPGLAPSCAEAGVLGVLPGVIGLLQAIEAIKILLGLGEVLVGSLLQYEALAGRFTRLTLERDPDCRYCATGAPFPGYADMEYACDAGPQVRPEVRPEVRQ